MAYCPNQLTKLPTRFRKVNRIGSNLGIRIVYTYCDLLVNKYCSLGAFLTKVISNQIQQILTKKSIPTYACYFGSSLMIGTYDKILQSILLLALKVII